jgi:LysM repeat protein
MRGNDRIARYAAPAAFLVAVTVALLLVRSGLESGEEATTTRPAATTVAATTEAQPPPTTTEAAPTTTAAGEQEFYEIQSGDTLAVVADRHGTTVEQLLVLNPDVDPVALTIGQRIRVN